MQKITPCLWFDTKAEEAAEFYVSVFPNSRIVEVSRWGDGGPRPADLALSVVFELDGQRYTALNGGPEFTFDEAVSFQIGCADQAEVDAYWEKLLAGGGEESRCGWLKDRYGLSWQVIPDQLPELLSNPDPETAKRVMQKMMTMGKLDIAELERAAEPVPVG
jgi:predicted 3-demethylubiquinone-9 3-methyltransferase (glyoxalase superfamily)